MWYEKDSGKIIKCIGDMPAGCFGFIYSVEFERPDAIGRDTYMGLKQVLSVRNIKKGVRELKAMTDKRGSKKKRVVKENDWLDYNGSCKDPVYLEMLETVPYKKYIVEYASFKKQLSYLETKHLFINNVLDNERFFNANIAGKYFSKDLIWKV